jgi:hypothetical protein
LDFRRDQVTCTYYDVIGKHIYEFKRRDTGADQEEVPEIFVLLVSYFEAQPELMRTEGLFRKAASMDKLDEMHIHMSMGNYYYLT